MKSLWQCVHFIGITYPLYCLTWSAAHLSFQNNQFGLHIFWDCYCWYRLYFFGQDLLCDCLLYWCCKYITNSPLFQVDQWNICIICIPRKRRMETNLSKEESVYKQHCIFPTFNCSAAVPCPLRRCQWSEIQNRNKSWGFGVLCRSVHRWTPLEGTLSRALKECHEEWSNIPVVHIYIYIYIYIYVYIYIFCTIMVLADTPTYILDTLSSSNSDYHFLHCDIIPVVNISQHQISEVCHLMVLSIAEIMYGLW